MFQSYIVNLMGQSGSQATPLGCPRTWTAAKSEVNQPPFPSAASLTSGRHFFNSTLKKKKKILQRSNGQQQEQQQTSQDNDKIMAHTGQPHPSWTKRRLGSPFMKGLQSEIAIKVERKKQELIGCNRVIAGNEDRQR